MSNLDSGEFVTPSDSHVSDAFPAKMAERMRNATIESNRGRSGAGIADGVEAFLTVAIAYARVHKNSSASAVLTANSNLRHHMRVWANVVRAGVSKDDPCVVNAITSFTSEADNPSIPSAEMARRRLVAQRVLDEEAPQPVIRLRATIQSSRGNAYVREVGDLPLFLRLTENEQIAKFAAPQKATQGSTAPRARDKWRDQV